MNNKLKPADQKLTKVNPKTNQARTFQLNDFNKFEINFYSQNITNELLDKGYKNIDLMSKYLDSFKNILFICSDYPGYGGAATNCSQLQNFFGSKHNTYSVYYNFDSEMNKKYETNSKYKIVNAKDLKQTLTSLTFKPDVIILKNFVQFNLKTIYKCPIFYFIAGIYQNNLDKYYYELGTKAEHDKYINQSVLNQIKNSDLSFCNSSHTRDILKKIYGLTTYLFYSGLVPFYGRKIPAKVEGRQYEYGLIESNFDRKIKNSANIIKNLASRNITKSKVILIGHRSSQFAQYGFITSELIDPVQLVKQYEKIKYIIQDSFYESCSNVKLEAIFNGCQIRHIPKIIVASTQYTSYGGAATNAYNIIKYLQSLSYNVCGLFFEQPLVPKDKFNPDGLKNIYLFEYKIAVGNNPYWNNIRSTILGKFGYPDLCLSKNYLAPIFTKTLFSEAKTFYLVAGISYFDKILEKSGKDIFNGDIMDLMKNIDSTCIRSDELKAIQLSDKTILNSKLSHGVFNILFKNYANKIYPKTIDTTKLVATNANEIVHIKTNTNKIYDILLCCSDFSRKIKNNKFLVEILNDQRLKKYNKCFVGNNNQMFNSCANSVKFNLLQNAETQKKMKESKLLLYPSVFDSNPNTVREAINNGCLCLISKNIGYSDNFPEQLICRDYKKETWVNKIIQLLENYSAQNNIKISFNDTNSIPLLNFIENN